MTAKEVMDRGLMFRKERGPMAKLDFQRAETARRFLLLPWVLEARRLNMRCAHRRWCRRNGCRFR